MTTTTTVQVHRIYIKAKPEAIWDAITKPEWTEKYGYGGRFQSDLRAGQPYQVLTGEEMKKASAEYGIAVPDVAIDGEVIEADPPHKLVLTWRMLMDPGLAEEGFTRLTYEIEEAAAGYAKLTVTHDLAGAPKLALMVVGEGNGEDGAGGWPWVLSDIKSLLETGTRLAG